MTVSNDSVAILRIELESIEPLIWRRVAVPTSMNLKAMHSVIQAAIGWLDCHLCKFDANGRKYSLFIHDDPDWNERITDAATTKLSALVAHDLTDIRYVYDMGDYWQHRVLVEKVGPADQRLLLYPHFLGGERRCPPEDCGGPPGYIEFIDNIASKHSKRRKVALDWYGRNYDPDDIDEKQIIAALKRILAVLIRP